MNRQGANFWQGRLVRPRGVEPSDAETFARWNLDGEMARELDFVREGTLRRMVFTGGRFHDLHHYGVLKEEWEQSPHRI